MLTSNELCPCSVTMNLNKVITAEMTISVNNAFIEWRVLQLLNPGNKLGDLCYNNKMTTVYVFHSGSVSVPGGLRLNAKTDFFFTFNVKYL